MLVVIDRFDVVALLALEFEHLKEEQRLRISTRDNLIYATLGSQALVVAAALQAAKPVMLLLLPPACVILGWTYLVNDDRVTAIGRHIEIVIVPELTRLVKPPVEVFSWERRHRSDRHRRSRKAWQLVVDLLVFCVPALAALVVGWRSGQLSTIFALVSQVELAGTILFGIKIAVEARVQVNTPASLPADFLMTRT